MAELYNLARETTTTTGTGTISLGGAVDGFLTFDAAGVQNSEQVYYGIKDGDNSEVGIGTYTTSGTTLTRGAIKSTNSDNEIDLSGDAEVYITALKETFESYQPLDATLTALAAYNTNGLLAQTAADTFAGRTLTQPAAGITVSNGDGVAGNPTLALANDLAALEGLGSTGLAARTAADTWAQRTITGTANEVNVSNGDGVSGNPTIGLPDDVVITTSLTVPNTGLHILDTNASHDLIIAPGSNITADRTLTITTGDADRTVTFSGNPTLADWFDQSVKVAATPQFASIELGHATQNTLTASGGVLSIEGAALYKAGGTDVALADGGTGASLADPGADRIMFWDDSAGAVTWLTAGSGLTITDTTITASAPALDIQTFNASDDWDKPASGTIALVECWGGGGSGCKGNTSAPGGGGGGGAYAYLWMLLSELASTVTVTIGAGGTAQTTLATPGNTGGSTTFGAHLTAYGGAGGGFQAAGGGGGGGGGALSAGSAGSGITGGSGGSPDGGAGVSTAPGAGSSFGGAAGAGGGDSTGYAGGFSMHGGGGGGSGRDGAGSATANPGGDSFFGGGGGGGGANSGSGGNAGTSVRGGNGSAGTFDANASSAGTQPGGGSGGTETGNSGAGGAGRCRVTVF